MENSIILILEEAAAYNLRNEVKYLAEMLISKHFEIYQRPVINHGDFYNLAFNTLIKSMGIEQNEVEVHPSYEKFDNSIFATCQEIDASLANIADIISKIDFKINSANIEYDNPMAPIVFILTDVYSTLLYYQLMNFTETYDSPITLLMTDDIYSKLNNLDKNSIIYLLSYHKNTNTENIIKYLTTKKIASIFNLTSIELLGKPEKSKGVHHVSVVYCDNQNVLIDAYGFGRPDRHNKFSEYRDIFINRTQI